jgi:predicted nucleic acid-binding protein
MTALHFVDANVLVYWRDASEPGKQSIAAQLLNRLWREQSGRISVQVLNEYFVTVTRKSRVKLDPAVAWNDVSTLLYWDPQPLNGPLLIRGREVQLQHRMSWWDSLVVAAAQLQGCSVLWTEDLQHGAQLGAVQVQNPFLPRIEDSPRPGGVELPRRRPHPSRGRPRRSGAEAIA